MVDSFDSNCMDADVGEAAPWHRQFWPWFLIALPATVVVASFFMLYLAIKYSDTLVSDNYYRDGLAINQVLSQDIRARQLGLSAQIHFAEDGAVVTAKLEAKLPQGLSLEKLDVKRGANIGVSVGAGSGVESGKLLSDKPEMPDILTLRLLHPTDALADTSVRLMAVGDGAYRGRLPVAPQYRFYLRLLPGLINTVEEGRLAGWRLAGEVDFATTYSVLLSAAPPHRAEGSLSGSAEGSLSGRAEGSHTTAEGSLSGRAEGSSPTAEGSHTTAEGSLLGNAEGSPPRRAEGSPPHRAEGSLD